MSYANRLNRFTDTENLSEKAWQHAVTIDLIATEKLKNCSLHCFHYQQMLEILLKYLLETKSLYGTYPHTHKLNKLLVALIGHSDLSIDKGKYFR